MTTGKKLELEKKCLQFRKDFIDLLYRIQPGHPRGK